MYNRGEPEQVPQVYKQEGHIYIIGASPTGLRTRRSHMYNRGEPEQAPQVYEQGHICIIGANLSKPHSRSTIIRLIHDIP